MKTQVQTLEDRLAALEARFAIPAKTESVAQHIEVLKEDLKATFNRPKTPLELKAAAAPCKLHITDRAMLDEMHDIPPGTAIYLDGPGRPEIIEITPDQDEELDQPQKPVIQPKPATQEHPKLAVAILIPPLDNRPLKRKEKPDQAGLDI